MSTNIPDPTENIDIPENCPRALLTDREIEVLIKGRDHPDVTSNHYSVTRSRVRKKAQRLVDELDLLEEHVPDAAATIRDGVCER